MLAEINHLQIPFPTKLIPNNKTTGRELLKQNFCVAVVIGKNLGLKLLWPIFKSPLSVGMAPKPLEQ